MIRPFRDKSPKVHETAFVSEAAYVVGDVVVKEGAVILPGAVLRGDVDTISVEAGAVVGENCVVHIDAGGLSIGTGAIIDSGAIIHCRAIKPHAFIGSNATLLEDVEVGESTMVQPGALVHHSLRIPGGAIVGGIPARVLGMVTKEEKEEIPQRRRQDAAAIADKSRLTIPDTCLVSETASIYGSVELADRVSIFPGVVLRGDVGDITIGKNSDIQDRGVVCPEPEGMDIGANVLIGHSVILHARKIGNNCLIGNNCTLSKGVEIGEFCVIGAGCMVPPDTRIPPYSFVLGVPATVRGRVSRERLATMGDLGEGYARNIKRSQRSGMDFRQPRHKGKPPMLVSLEGKAPKIADSAYVNETSYIIGDVEMGEGSSLWPGTVVRGDLNRIIIGRYTNIQDNTVVHGNGRTGTIIGDNVMIGHGCMVHAKKIGNNCLIGNNATVLENVEIGDFCIVAANAVVPPRAVIPSHSFVSGVPAKERKTIPEGWQERLYHLGEYYARRAQEYKAAGL